jgi:hypothetical protein
MEGRDKMESTHQDIGAQIVKSWRFRLGLFFFVSGWICPLLIPVVAVSSLSNELKTAISGFLLIGIPEIFSFISIALFGKQGFNLITSKLFGFLKNLIAFDRVSRTRYRIGLGMLILHILNGIMIYYFSDKLPWYLNNQITYNVVSDILFVITLFILGGDFWEKLGALFNYDAKVINPGFETIMPLR